MTPTGYEVQVREFVSDVYSAEPVRNFGIELMID